MPALFTNILSGPKTFSASAITPAHDSADVTSCSRKIAPSPSSEASARPEFLDISVNTTFAPSSMKRRACDSPMPRAAPVINAVFPVNLPIVPPLSWHFRNLEFWLWRNERFVHVQRVAVLSDVCDALVSKLEQKVIGVLKKPAVFQLCAGTCLNGYSRAFGCHGTN